LAGRFRQSAWTGPDEVLNRLQQIGQHGGTNPGAEAGQHHGQPEPGGRRMSECGGYLIGYR
jgi:hypothetical protein